MITRSTLMVALVAITAGCATRPASAQLAPSNVNSITAEDIFISGGRTAYDGVFLLRGGIEIGRSIPSLNDGQRAQAVVYLDGVRVDFEVLRSIDRTEVESMQYMDPMDANMRYGINHQGGAIIVRTVIR